jgi:hypothetical protein
MIEFFALAFLCCCMAFLTSTIGVFVLFFICGCRISGLLVVITGIAVLGPVFGANYFGWDPFDFLIVCIGWIPIWGVLNLVCTIMMFQTLRHFPPLD